MHIEALFFSGLVREVVPGLGGGEIVGLKLTLLIVHCDRVGFVEQGSGLCVSGVVFHAAFTSSHQNIGLSVP